MKPFLARLALAALALVLALGAPSCASLGSKVDPGESFEIDAPSENVLWAVAGQELQRLGFPVGGDADPAARVMRSGWRTSLAPFRGKGHRERAELRFEPLGAERFELELRVERENNMNLARPLDPASAEWKSAPDDQETALVLAERIRARLSDTLEVGPAPRKL